MNIEQTKLNYMKTVVTVQLYEETLLSCKKYGKQINVALKTLSMKCIV